MSFVVDAFEDVGDAIGDVFEGAGNIIEDVGDALGDAGRWVDDNILQPIARDPITFIAAAVAYSYGIPGLEFAGPGTAAATSIATTGSRLVQGDDFDDAIKAGVTAGISTGITNSIGAGVSSGGQNWSPNLYTTAEEAAANALRSAAASSSASSPNASPNAVASSADDQLLRDLDDIASRPRYQPDIEYEPTAGLGDDVLTPKYTDRNPLGGDPLDIVDTSSNPPVVPDATPPVAPPKPKASFTGQDVDIYKSSIDTPSSTGTNKIFDIGENIKNVPTTVADVSGVKDVGRSFSLDDYTGDVPIENRSRVEMPGSNAPSSLRESLTNLGGAVLETAGNWAWDGAKWVWNNPTDALMYGTAGAGLAKNYLNQDDTPSGNQGKSEDQKNADKLFYSPLQQLELDRSRTANPFDRTQNPYESNLYTYGQNAGEHAFYGDTIYSPVSYSQPVTAAQGGAIGALSSQTPSYYRYGSMPMNMASGGYASGGLRSLKDDGRSDHIPAMLSDGEFVVDAETVALLGNGSNEAGANRLEGMRQEVRKQKGKALSRGKFSPDAKSPLSYIKQRRG